MLWIFWQKKLDIFGEDYHQDVRFKPPRRIPDPAHGLEGRQIKSTRKEPRNLTPRTSPFSSRMPFVIVRKAGVLYGARSITRVTTTQALGSETTRKIGACKNSGFV